jgi:predicted nucleotidyltransferase
MKETVSILEQLGKDRSVTILYACETGSRAWGFPSPDSDYDVRFIYMHKPDWYLSLGTRKDTIEYMDGDWDVTGWDLRKCLQLLKKSNAPLIERFQSPIVYHAQPGFVAAFQSLIAAYYSPTAVFFHHYSLAHKFWAAIKDCNEYKLKSWFYLVRSLLSCNWIINDKTVLPMHVEGLMQYVEPIYCEALRSLIALKASVGEKYLHQADPFWQDWIAEQFAFIEQHKDNLGVCKQGMDLLDNFFLKMLYGQNYN